MHLKCFRLAIFSDILLPEKKICHGQSIPCRRRYQETVLNISNKIRKIVIRQAETLQKGKEF